MKRVVVAAFVLAVLGWSAPVHAVIGAVDKVPAATLLLPYFEVDLDNPQGVTTLMSINNASNAGVLAHVVIWTDLSVPTFTFDVYLTGYDVQTINLRDIFVNGVLPRTADHAHDPTGTISPKGIFSNETSYASCVGLPPGPIVPTSLQLAHTGQPSPNLANQCAGRALGDRIARGYITVDTVSACSNALPGDSGYFVSGGLGLATNVNALWGDYFYVNPGQNFAQGETLVHIEAAPGIGNHGLVAADFETATPGQYTFYGRYVNWTAADNREPLATNFAVRYINGGSFDGGTDLIVWRDSKFVTPLFECPVVPGVKPPWYPLGQEAIVIFDETENPFVVPGSPFGPQPNPPGPIPFAAEAQRVQLGSPDFFLPFNFGWIYLNLNVTVTPVGPNPAEDPAAAQAWVTVVHDASGRFSVGYNAAQLDSATKAVHFAPGP